MILCNILILLFVFYFCNHYNFKYFFYLKKIQIFKSKLKFFKQIKIFVKIITILIKKKRRLSKESKHNNFTQVKKILNKFIFIKKFFSKNFSNNFKVENKLFFAKFVNYQNF